MPKPQRGDPDKRNKSRYYEYHKDAKHHTNECYRVRRLLNFMAQKRDLQEYIEEMNPTNSRSIVRSPRSITSKNPRSLIDTILASPMVPRIRGQPYLGTLVARIHYSFASSNIRPIDGTITFSKSPLQQLSMPHDDILILTLEVGNHLGVAIRVNGSYSCRVNIRIVSTFANPNPTRIINVSTFANPNPTHLLFVLGRSTRI